jgi:hypothetical protein
MAPRLYALLAGINAYPPEVGVLAGCLNDVDHFHAWLKQQSGPADLAVEVLKDGDATRANVIDGFRRHLGQARAGDVAVFHYCGHGARSASNDAFRPFYPDGKDEGLVCFDSRLAGGHDLADKELAVLVAELSQREAHVAVLLDCCHSGSGTRGVDAFRGLVPRLTHEVLEERPLESYLGGHYARLLEAGRPLTLPAARHILLAACERGQLAQESADRSGVFTSTLIEVLQKSGGALSYADLFVRCRAAVRSRADDQNPQFEACDRFDAGTGFLGRSVARGVRRYSTGFDRGAWRVDCGAIHGLPTDPDTPVALALYREGDASLAGTATAVAVGAQKSELALDFEADETARFSAEITSLPAPPMLLAFAGDEAARSAMQAALDRDGSVPVSLVGGLGAARYGLTARGGRLSLAAAGAAEPIAHAQVADAAALLPVLQQVLAWERAQALQNQRTAMDTSLVEFAFEEQLDGGGTYTHPGNDLTVDCRRQGADWRGVYGRLKVRSRTAQPLHMVLAYCSAAYGIHILNNEPVPPGETWMTLWGDEDNFFYLDPGVDESIECFQLIVTIEKVDDFLLAQPDLELGRECTGTRAISTVKPPRRRVHENEWFTLSCRIRVVRQIDQVARADARLAQGRVVVKGHPDVTAQISLGGVSTGTRGAGSDAGFCKAMAGCGLTLVNLAGTRGDAASVLELTGIQNVAALAAQPLEIELNLPLADGEAILPLAFDGQHVVLGGMPEQTAAGSTLVRIDHLPATLDNRRSLGGSLKLYFFKTWLKRADVNRLRWVEALPDGRVLQHDDGVAGKVAAAQRVLLLVHGIIGDTAGMSQGAVACGLHEKFDLVLSYDYENLSTPIADTARALKAALQAAGLHADDGKHLTLLVHSMGGLVSRWFIEREGGQAVVDHLVMCGTPNGGSPFGRIDEARQLVARLTEVAANHLPALLPFSAAMLFLLNRSRLLTPALEQMNPASDFIRALNESPDPGVRYTILAGDVGAYHQPGDPLFARLLAQAGQSRAIDALFDQQPNDIAVGVASILTVNTGRQQAPTQVNVPCHHLNYFVCDAGQLALKAVAW